MRATLREFGDRGFNMKITSLFGALAAVSMVAAPLGAQAAPRHASPAKKAEAIAENPWIPIAVLIGVALAIILVIADDNSKSP